MTPPPEGLSDVGRAAWDKLFGPPIAHRGLWRADGPEGPEPPENSLRAFVAAAQAGYGIELDVRLSADGEAMVFHDADLLRMTGEEGPLEARTVTELARLRLQQEGSIPTLKEALEAVGGGALVLIELKEQPDNHEALAARTAEVAAAHAGPMALIGFHPNVHLKLAELRPDILRGAHVAIGDAYGEVAETARSHFLLPGLEVLRLPEIAARRAAGKPLVAWTTRDPAQHAGALEFADNVIFEGYRPQLRDGGAARR